MTIVTLLVFILGGSLIGYLANALVLAMLFRPSKAHYFLGKKLPFTPGILNANQRAIAELIGDAVEKEFLSEEAIRKNAREGEFLKSVESTVSGLLDRFLGTRLGELSKGEENPTIDSIASSVASIFVGFTQTKEFEVGLKSLVALAVDYAGELPVKKLIKQEDLVSIVEGILDWVSSTGNRERIHEIVDSWLREQEEKNLPMGVLLPGDLPSSVESVANFLYPSLLRAISNLLDEDDIQAALTQWGRGLVKMIIKKLSLFQRILISAAQYDKSLEEQMPGIVEDITMSIRNAGSDEDTKRNIIQFAKDRAKDFSLKGFNEVVSPSKGDLVEKLHRIIDLGANLLTKQETRESLSGLLASTLDGLSERTLLSIADEYLSLTRESIIDFLSKAILRGIESVKGNEGRSLVSFVERLLLENSQKSLRDILGLKEEQIKSLSKMLSKKGVELIEEFAPSLSRSIDAKRNIVKQIEGINVADIEKYLTKDMRPSLSLFPIVGAILGCIMGALLSILYLMVGA